MSERAEAADHPPRGTRAPETSKTLDRGIRLLEVLARPDLGGGLTITELAAQLDVGRPVVYRLVTALEAHHLVARRPNGRVRLGLGVSRLAAAVRPLVRSEARPILQELADAVGATAHLTVAEADEALALVVVEPTWTDFHVAYRAGTRHPLHLGAAGRAILAGRSGSSELVISGGEIQPGAHGLAIPVLAAATDAGEPERVVDASVGVVALGPIDPVTTRPRLERAARALSTVLR
ncbi:IclR family transcriptional regulator [Intrasporangium calvum]|uniref:Transcriptional regulator, IclR family n=1 Tax=Intrasporangium calvum (strain ATCC 23552 / DSM 43043 / JCM 3097 / NBRC 12989 / NCIMB 10167 / NRRL B-3866 / 7 KIP) TaxID=710696 RepID=E6S685_INTC7|nr:helix-turn-helix domain-containing protein [Intrasporangium calvum]ADU47836.1 transcriptional regulator, IclR family [Intrasporangium calvum DSM 43043]AXG12947.1 IclR family transcriptional regulator [Intrasporangium calvum]